MKVSERLKKMIRSPIFWLTVVFIIVEIVIFKAQAFVPCAAMCAVAYFFQRYIKLSDAAECYAFGIAGILISAVAWYVFGWVVAAVYLFVLSAGVIVLVVQREYKGYKKAFNGWKKKRKANTKRAQARRIKAREIDADRIPSTTKSDRRSAPYTPHIPRSDWTNVPPTNKPFEGKKTSRKQGIYDEVMVAAHVEGMVERLKVAGLDKYLLSDFKCSHYVTVKELQEKTAAPKLNLILIEIEKYLGLWPIKLEVEYVKESNNDNEVFAVGSFERRNGNRLIRLKIPPYHKTAQLTAILCHECTHYFMYMNNLDWEDTVLNEPRTDMMAILLGFGKELAIGYEPIETTSFMNGGEIRKTENHKLGYLSVEDCELVIRERAHWQEEKRKWDAEKARKEELWKQTAGLRDELAAKVNEVRAVLAKIGTMNLYEKAKDVYGNPGFLYALSDYEGSDLPCDDGGVCAYGGRGDCERGNVRRKCELEAEL